jgi:hypothetical protein
MTISPTKKPTIATVPLMGAAQRSSMISAAR